jgi:hypothetical protein
MPKKTDAKRSPKRPTASRSKVKRGPPTVDKKIGTGRVSGRTPGGSADLDPNMQAYDRAIELFNAGRFQAAKDVLAKLVNAPNRDLAHSAELRMKICEQRLTLAKHRVNAESE